MTVTLAKGVMPHRTSHHEFTQHNDKELSKIIKTFQQNAAQLKNTVQTSHRDNIVKSYLEGANLLNDELIKSLQQEILPSQKNMSSKDIDLVWLERERLLQQMQVDTDQSQQVSVINNLDKTDAMQRLQLILNRWIEQYPVQIEVKFCPVKDYESNLLRILQYIRDKKRPYMHKRKNVA